MSSRKDPWDRRNPPVPEGAPDYREITPAPDLVNELLRTSFVDSMDSFEGHITNLRVRRILLEAVEEGIALKREQQQCKADLELARQVDQQLETEYEAENAHRDEVMSRARRLRRPISKSTRLLGTGLVASVAVFEVLLILVGFDALVPDGSGLLHTLRPLIVLLGTLGASFACAAAVHIASSQLAELQQAARLRFSSDPSSNAKKER